MKSAYYFGASLAVIALAVSPARAQTGEGAQNGADDKTTEIVITGTKREQALSKAPIAVSVFSEKEIEQAGITRPQDFLLLSPNVNFVQGNNTGESFVSIRGQNSARLAEASVAFIIDGVQLASSNEFSGELFDIQQIEVLKGPQSAIYGRNATAGAIVITTKAPTDKLEGQLVAGWGNWNTMRMNGSLSGAIIPGALRFRLAVAASDSDGPFTNINTGEKVSRSNEKTARLRLDWDRGGNTKADLRAAVSKLKGGSLAYKAQLTGITVAGVSVLGIDANDTSLPWTSDVAGFDKQDKFSASLKVDHKFGDHTLTSITAFNKVDNTYGAKNFPYQDWTFPGSNFATDVFSPGLPLDMIALFGDNTQMVKNNNKAFTQEVRFTSPSSNRLRWQVGASYLNAERDYAVIQGLNGRFAVDSAGNLRPPFVIAGTNIGAPVAPVERTIIGGGVIRPGFAINTNPLSNNPTLNFDSYLAKARNMAVFANAQFDVTDSLEFSAAGRYDVEKRKIRTLTPDIANPFFGLAPGAPFSTYNFCVANTGRDAENCKDSKTFRQFEPKVSLIYKIRNGSVYASWGKGFKSGGFNAIGTRGVITAGAPDSLVQDSYDKEVTDSYEIGFKIALFRRRLMLNGAAFKSNVKNSQVYQFFPTGGVQAVTSLKKVEIKGIEADFQAQPIDAITIFGGFGIVDAKTKDINDQNPAVRASIIGKRVPYVPNYSVNAGVQLVQPISDSLDFSARGEYIRTGSMWFDPTNVPNSKRDPLNLVNARAGLSGKRWEIAGWARNLTNEKYNQDAIPILPDAEAAYQALTRSYGVELKYKF